MFFFFPRCFSLFKYIYRYSFLFIYFYINWRHDPSKAWLRGRFSLQIWERKHPEASRRVQRRERKQHTKHGQQIGPGHERREVGESMRGRPRDRRQGNLWPKWQGDTGKKSWGKGSKGYGLKRFQVVGKVGKAERSLSEPGGQHLLCCANRHHS